MAPQEAECVICFEPLHAAPVAVLQREGRRACRHFFHAHCAKACPISRGCPLCRAEYSRVAPVPPLTLAKAWFQMMDVDQNGRLDQREVLHATAATLPVDCEALEAALLALWPAQTNQRASTLSFAELLGPNGLLVDLQSNLKQARARSRCRAAGSLCPDLDMDKRAWFLFWDIDGSRSLEREEIVRGLVKSFKSDLPRVLFEKRLRMRYVVEEMWPLVDTDANNRITVDEFCRPGGLADLILQRFAARGGPRIPRSPQSSVGPRPSGQQSPRGQLSPRGLQSQRSADGTSSRGSAASTPSSRPSRRPRSPRGSARAPTPTPPQAAQAKESAPVSKWVKVVTDIADGGEVDRPALACRPSLGFGGLAPSDEALDRRGARAPPSRWMLPPQLPRDGAEARGEHEEMAPWSVCGRLRSRELADQRSSERSGSSSAPRFQPPSPASSIGIASGWLAEPARGLGRRTRSKEQPLAAPPCPESLLCR